MQVNISRKRALQSAILFLMAAAIVLVWPLKIIRPWRSVGEIDPYSDRFAVNESTMMQEFVPEMYGLSYISFYIYNEDLTDLGSEQLTFRIFDENLQKLEEKAYYLDKLKIPGLCRIRIGSQLQVGSRYYFTVENPGTELVFSVSDEGNMDALYEYKALFTKPQYALYALAVLLIGGLLLFIIELLLKRDAYQVKFDTGFRLAVSFLVLGISLWGAWNVFPAKKFSENWIDIVFYEAGIFLFLFLALYSLLYKRKVQTGAIMHWEDIWKNIHCLLQSLAFAGVMLGGVRYLNALNLHQQKLASNLVLIFFAIALILSFTKKEILNWYNLIYLIPAISYGIYFCRQQMDDPEIYSIHKGVAAYTILWGLVALNSIRLLIRNKKNKISWVYFVALVLLAAEMVRSRNERTWPIDIAVFWGIFAIQVICRGEIQQYLNRFTNGVFIHFIGISIYAILYRPFHYYHYTRYPGVFHTVTVTAVYLVFVLVLALIRFLMIYKNNNSLRESWKEIWLVGMAAAFLLLTVSRTGFLAALILVPLLFLVTTVTEFKDGIRGIAKRAVVFICTTVCFFPIVFTACRIVPAVVGKPFTYEIEWFIGSVKAGEEWDSQWFVTVPRFFGVADAKMSYNENPENVPAGTTGGVQQQTAGAPAVEQETPKAADYSSGRLDIYRLYLKQLNWTGHKTVILLDENGKEIAHAHDVFIQVAHDFGIGAGLYFIVFFIFAGIRSIYYYFKHKGEDTALIPVGILGVFGICGLVEWVFLPYIPTGFAFLFILVLLIPANTEALPEKVQQEG